MYSGERSIRPVACPVPEAGRKISAVALLVLWRTVSAAPGAASRPVLERVAQQQVAIGISVRQVNRWRARWGLNRRRGRPPRAAAARRAALVKVEPHLTYAGVHLFAQWVEVQGVWTRALAVLQQAIGDYGAAQAGEDFPLLHHRAETVARRWRALLYAPLIDIEKLTALDVQPQPLATLVGRRYQSSTLTQFLGQLERIDAAAALMPMLAPAAAGTVAYVDGHMIAFWTMAQMHKGKITMLGRIMAGTQAVIAHNADGQALWAEHYPPDQRLTNVIMAYGERIVAATGIRVFVIDREVNSAPLAARFAERQWGLLSMLDKNEYDGLASWTTTRIGQLDDGSPVYEATWKTPRPDDVRQFVLVETAARVLAYWGTPAVAETYAPMEWPDLYRARTVVQEHQFKRMIAQGALNTNYGIKKIDGPDRHQQRAQAALEETQAAARAQVEKKTAAVAAQTAKVAESTARGHGRRLEQRQRRLAAAAAQLQQATARRDAVAAQLQALGPTGTRADRDVRKQRIMTFRTLLLTNLLLTFLRAVNARLAAPISWECLLALLFKRPGAYVETATEIIYWLDAAGLSQAYARRLAALAPALTELHLTGRGKPVRVQVRDGPARAGPG